MNFIAGIIDRAKADKKTIVLPESYEPRVIEACARILQQGFADIVLIGDRQKIQTVCPEWDISKARVVDPLTYPRFEEYVDMLSELRKEKGMTPEMARTTLADPLYFGVMMIKMQDADGMVAGAINSTANTLRPALQILKVAPGAKIVSSFMVMSVPDCEYGDCGTLAFSDCGILEDPAADQLSEIALSAAQSYRQLVGDRPNVAMLSYSSYGSAKSPLTDKVVEATKLAKAKAPDINLDGELQLDSALDMAVARSKAPGSQVAGRANVLIFPNLDAGNIGYKLVQRLGKAEAYGPITQGLARPVNDLSRGCSVRDIVGVVAITAVQAQGIG